MNTMTILLVEDNSDHALLIQRGLDAGNIVNQVIVVKDGQEALDYLYQRGLYADPYLSPRPDFILLDIKLPKISGIEVLHQIKQDPALKLIPVIMLTSSELTADIQESYQAGANSYVTKPLRFGELMEKVRELETYWASINNLPPESVSSPPASSPEAP